MENIVAQTVKKLYLELLKADENFLADTTDLYTYEMNLVESMRNAVTSHLSATLTQLNGLIEKDSSRSSRFTIDRRDQRTLITTFGVVTFEHTYFRDRETGKRRYLLDEMLQLDPHERLSQAAETAVLTEAARSSYQKAGDVLGKDCAISKTAVMGKVHAIVEEMPLLEKVQKTCAEYLYIEADEDHIHYQGNDPDDHKNGMIGKLIYLYESKKETCKGHRELVQAFYLGGLYRGSTENGRLWDRVQEYILKNYDTSFLKKVYINGDGGAWIKAGVNHVAKSVFVLDKYHMMAYINGAANQMLDEANIAKGHLWKALYKGKQKKFMKCLRKIRKCAPNEKKVDECAAYFENNWEAAVLRMQDKVVFGSSTEAHVSHVYSDRMSTRPMAWSETGADRMCRLRCFVRDYGEDKIIDLVRCRRQRKQKQEVLATGTDGMPIKREMLRHGIREHRDQTRVYIERLQSSIPDGSIRKALSIRERIHLI
jgi:hypothetical protein